MRITLSVGIDVDDEAQLLDVKDVMEDLQKNLRQWRSKAKLAKGVKAVVARVKFY
jgi:D-alanyl-D-alanine dipeptidase